LTFERQVSIKVPVFWSKQKKEEKRFYLMPGMGGRALKRKRRVILQASIVAGLLASALLAGILYLMNHRF
jgi:hypothetical protein